MRHRYLNPYNPITLIDFYKSGHIYQYPADTTRIYSNLTPRGSRFDGVDEIIWFGLQPFLKRILDAMFAEFFAADLDDVVDAYKARMDGALGPGVVGTEHIAALHELGYLPIRICALPEGTRVPMRVPVLTIENTIDEFAWLTNYLETILSVETWLSSTTATQADRMRKMLDRWAAATSDTPEAVDFQAHDFSMRGMASLDAAAASGSAHLLSFAGTDTAPALDWIDVYYPHEPGTFLGGSVPATEHSVMCAGGEVGEVETFARLLETYPTGIVSVVSDTWDLWEVLTEHLPNLFDEIMVRDGKLVVRPDSGDPVKIMCGDPDAPAGSPEAKGVIELLWDVFGGTVNSKGYRVLDAHIGAIYGDSITFERADAICAGLAGKGFASTNFVLGVGSFSYQYVTRDSLGFAVKSTWAKVAGVDRDLAKNPVTDNGVKRSATGRLAVVRDDAGVLTLIEQATPAQEAASMLRPVFENGSLLVDERWETVVARVGNRIAA